MKSELVNVSARTLVIGLLAGIGWSILPREIHAQSCWEPARPQCSPSMPQYACHSELLSYLDRDRQYRECLRIEKARGKGLPY